MILLCEKEIPPIEPVALEIVDNLRKSIKDADYKLNLCFAQKKFQEEETFKYSNDTIIQSADYPLCQLLNKSSTEFKKIQNPYKIKKYCKGACEKEESFTLKQKKLNVLLVFDSSGSMNKTAKITIESLVDSQKGIFSKFKDTTWSLLTVPTNINEANKTNIIRPYPNPIFQCDDNDNDNDDKKLLIESSDENPETSLEGIFSKSGFCPMSTVTTNNVTTDKRTCEGSGYEYGLLSIIEALELNHECHEDPCTWSSFSTYLNRDEKSPCEEYLKEPWYDKDGTLVILLISDEEPQLAQDSRNDAFTKAIEYLKNKIENGLMTEGLEATHFSQLLILVITRNFHIKMRLIGIISKSHVH